METIKPIIENTVYHKNIVLLLCLQPNSPMMPVAITNLKVNLRSFLAKMQKFGQKIAEWWLFGQNWNNGKILEKIQKIWEIKLVYLHIKY